MVGGGGVTVWSALGPRVARRGLWTVSVVIVAIAASSVLVDAAPPSMGVLEDRLDELTLPFYEVTTEERSGNSRCRPACPRLHRTLRAPVGSVEAAGGEVRAAFNRHPELPALPDDSFSVEGEDVRVVIELSERVEDGIAAVDVDITLQSISGL